MEEQQNTLGKKEENYIFGDFFGNLMRKTTIKFQVESAMMSLVMIILSVSVTAVYVSFWSDWSLFLKIMAAVNAFFGDLLLFSQLAGMFQSYQSIVEAQNVQDLVSNLMKDDSMKGGNA